MGTFKIPTVKWSNTEKVHAHTQAQTDDQSRVGREGLSEQWSTKIELLIINPLDQNNIGMSGHHLMFFPSLKLSKFFIINCIYETATHTIQCCNFFNSIIKILFSCLDQYESHGWLRLNTIPHTVLMSVWSLSFHLSRQRSNVATPLMTRTNRLVLTDTVHTHFPMPLHWSQGHLLSGTRYSHYHKHTTLCPALNNRLYKDQCYNFICEKSSDVNFNIRHWMRGRLCAKVEVCSSLVWAQMHFFIGDSR